VIVRNESAGMRLSKGDSIWIALVNCRKEPGVDCIQSNYEENYQQLRADAVPEAPPGLSADHRADCRRLPRLHGIGSA
jgi:hypothetical protein